MVAFQVWDLTTPVQIRAAPFSFKMALYTPIRRKEHSGAYKKFKEASKEDEALISYIKNQKIVDKEDTILDVGGRRGQISLKIQSPEKVTIVDVDPKVKPFDSRAKMINKSIQEAEPELENYDLILISHILGDLGYAEIQGTMVKKLFNHLKPKGKIILCFNKNGDFLDELKKHFEFAFPNIKTLYDYFDETILEEKPLDALEKKNYDFSVTLKADSFRELAAYCWVLFSGYELEEEPVVGAFEKFLKKNLEKPEFVFNQRIILLQKD